MVQQNVVEGVLQKPQDGDAAQSDWMLSMVELFKAGKYKEARTLICDQARPEEYDDVVKLSHIKSILFRYALPHSSPHVSSSNATKKYK